jgi:hypothetical protein
MTITMHDPATASLEETAAVEAIRDVCKQTEPDVLWEALAAKGIDTTPGMIYQVLHKPHDPEQALTPAGESARLSAEDMATVSALAVKAGGVEQLIRILQVWQEHAT